MLAPAPLGPCPVLAAAGPTGAGAGAEAAAALLDLGASWEKDAQRQGVTCYGGGGGGLGRCQGSVPGVLARAPSGPRGLAVCG